jgi:hypothetical protein
MFHEIKSEKILITIFSLSKKPYQEKQQQQKSPPLEYSFCARKNFDLITKLLCLLCFVSTNEGKNAEQKKKIREGKIQ